MNYSTTAAQSIPLNSTTTRCGAESDGEEARPPRPCEREEGEVSNPMTPTPDNEATPCPRCDGTGKYARLPWDALKPCAACSGTGQIEPEEPESTMNVTNEMVDRFLNWPLPADVRSDACVTMQGYPHRIGTNLLTADQARQMLEYVLATPPSETPKGEQSAPELGNAELEGLAKIADTLTAWAEYCDSRGIKLAKRDELRSLLASIPRLIEMAREAQQMRDAVAEMEAMESKPMPDSEVERHMAIIGDMVAKDTIVSLQAERNRLSAEFERVKGERDRMGEALPVVRGAANRLAMLALQSDRYSSDIEYREAVDAVLTLPIYGTRDAALNTEKPNE